MKLREEEANEEADKETDEFHRMKGDLATSRVLVCFPDDRVFLHTNPLAGMIAKQSKPLLVGCCSSF